MSSQVGTSIYLNPFRISSWNPYPYPSWILIKLNWISFLERSSPSTIPITHDGPTSWLLQDKTYAVAWFPGGLLIFPSTAVPCPNSDSLRWILALKLCALRWHANSWQMAHHSSQISLVTRYGASGIHYNSGQYIYTTYDLFPDINVQVRRNISKNLVDVYFVDIWNNI